MAVTYKEGRVLFTATGNTTTETGPFMVKGFNWSGAANTNTLVVDDEDDFELFNAVAETGALEVNYNLPKPLPATQIKVTMGGGTLLVYI